ncbi:MAG: hypothetical protein IPM84_16595 [Anaerolineae bacterium]|nr:hypothetical protein [Anaerolineae bacterium]
MADVDGISFDPATGVLYGVSRREGTNTQLDVLIKIDPVTGKHINSAFGTGVDYIKIRTDLLATPLYEIDDISFDPVSGSLYAIANGTSASPSVGDRLVILNKSTGAVTDVARVTKSTGGNLDDVEGLSFYGDGGLYATTGYHAATGDTNKLWELDKDTAIATEAAVLGTQSTYNDYEAVACQGGSLSTGSTPSNQVETALTASIGDRVWSDVDGDGVQDPGEPGLGGIEVCATPTGGGAAVCDTTDAFGNYRIYGLTNLATYNVALTPATIPDGTTPTFVPPQPVTATTAGTLTADFGLRPPGTASIGDTVWLDANNNGSLDGAEQGLPNITVKLYIDQNNNGVVDGGDTLIQTQTTDAFGNYLFGGLHPDDYLVVVDTASSVTSPYDGTTTIAAAMAPTTGTTNPRDVTITTPGQAITNADFGYNWGGSIGDTVWLDTNQDQVVDPGETRLQGATVLLYFDADNDGVIDPSEYAPVAFVETDVNGNYLFSHLPPGNYLVDVYEDSITTDGVRDIVSTTPDVRDVDLNPSQSVLTADFGYYLGAKVEGNVFWDENRNALLDPGEQDAPHLLENVTVNITCLGADGLPGGGDDFVGSQSTDANGHFSFIVPPGPCTVSYVTSDPDIPAALGDQTTPTSYTFTAQAGEDWHPSFDFGVDNTAAIGDTIFVDANGNGVQDGGEPGLPNVTVYLYQDVGVIGVYEPGIDLFLAADGSDAQGKYLFDGLPNGNYLVRVNTLTLPTDYAETADPDQPGVPCTVCDNTAVAAISGGNDLLTRDFGYQYQPGGIPASTNTISGVLWNDQDGDGVPDVGEPMLTGVSVVVDCGANGTFLATTGALVLGRNWSVAGVPDGSNCTITPDPTTLPLGYDPTTVTSRTVTNVQTDVSSQNFGYWLQPSSLSGKVVVGTGNGQADPGETPLSGVTVTLRFAGADGILGTADDVLSATTTDPTGVHLHQPAPRPLPGGRNQSRRLRQRR